MKQRILHGSLVSLAHPVTLAALLLLLVNDQVLRRWWPSTVTGKLGDFAWLFFMPLVLTALLALVAPTRSQRLVRLAAPLGFGVTGAIFALAKTLPSAHDAVMRVAGLLAGFPIGWRRDPTDLVALLALVPAWVLWRRQIEHLPSAAQQATRDRGWVVLPLAALLTLANGPAPDPGICRLEAAGGQIVATSAYGMWTSTDSGLTWVPGSNGAQHTPVGLPEAVVDPRNPSTQYRVDGNGAVERSEDRGATWQIERYVGTSEAERTYYARTHTGNPSVGAVPCAVAADPATGNIIFGMGHAGVLVRTPAGQWQRVGVGAYQQYGFTLQAMLTLLIFELQLAVGVFLLVVATLALPLGGRRRLRTVFAVLAWLAWIGCTLLAPISSTAGPYGPGIMGIALLVGGVIAFPLAADATLRAGFASRRLFGRLLGVGLAAALLFILPFLLWAAAALPNYTLALAFAYLLAGAALYAGHKYWTTDGSP
jgi:hypothetical protein